MISNSTSYKLKACKSTRELNDSDNNHSDEIYGENNSLDGETNLNDNNTPKYYGAYSRDSRSSGKNRGFRSVGGGEFRSRASNNERRGYRGRGAPAPGRRLAERNGSDTNYYILNRKYQESSRSESGSHKFYETDVKLNLPEDTRISKLLRRLSTEIDPENSLAISKKLLEVLLLPDNSSYVRKAFHILGDSMYEILQVSPGSLAKQQAARALGRMGYIMGQENDFERYQNWLFNKMGAANEEMQILLMNSLKETLALEEYKPVLEDSSAMLIHNLVSSIEKTDNVDIFKVMLDVLMTTAEIYSSSLYVQFQDTVDLLFGWHVDHTQPLSNIEFISRNLQRISAHFKYNLDFAVLLVKNFLEDIGNCGEQLTDANVIEHVTVLILALNTVLKCLQDSFHPANNKYVDSEFISNCLTQIIKIASDGAHNDNLIIAANESVGLLIGYVETKVQSLSSLIYNLIDLELSLVSNFDDAAVVSVLVLVAKIIKELSANLPADLIEKLIGPGSELIKLRTSHLQNIQDSVICVYQALLNLKNVSLLQEAYRYVLGDLEQIYTQISNVRPFIANNPFQGAAPRLDDDAKELTLLFLVRCLSQLANASSIIVMWALNPSILELVGVNLEPHSEQLARYSPAVQYSLLFLLYSHCRCYNHFISSSNLVANKHNVVGRFTLSDGLLSKNDVPNTSPNLGNFEIILDILHRTLSTAGTTTEVKVLLLQWLNDILTSSDSYLKNLYDNDKFMAVTKSLVKCGYNCHDKVVLAVCDNLDKLLSNKELSWSNIFLSNVCDLCKLHLNSNNCEVRAQYSKLVANIPWDVAIVELNKPATYQRNGNKITSLGYSNYTVWLAQHLHLTTVPAEDISPFKFKLFMNYLLKNDAIGDDWLQDIFISTYKIPDFTYELALNCRPVLYNWMTLESVRFCVNSKLRTPLGKPNETFTKIEAALNHLGNHLIANKKKETPDRDGHRIKYLLQFIEHLEKFIYNAAEGCAIAMQQPPKQVRSFFIANTNTCNEWITRIRLVVIHISMHAGDSCTAFRHAQALLEDLLTAGKTSGTEFDRAVMFACLTLLNLREPEALMGLYLWCKNVASKKFVWIKCAAEQSSKRYEIALDGYKKILADLETNDDLPSATNLNEVRHFIFDQIVACFKELGNWVDLVDWRNEQILLNNTVDNKYWFAVHDWDCTNILFQIEMDCHSFEELSKWEYKNNTSTWSQYENLTTVESNLYGLALNIDHKSIDHNMTAIQTGIRYHLDCAPSDFLQNFLVMQYVNCGIKSILNNTSTVFLVSEDFDAEIAKIESSVLRKFLWWSEYFKNVVSSTFVTDVRLNIIKRARREKNYRLAFNQLNKFLRGKDLQVNDSSNSDFAVMFMHSLVDIVSWDVELGRAATEIIKLSYSLESQRQNTFNLCAATSTAISKHAELYGGPDLKMISSKILLKLAEWLQTNDGYSLTEINSPLGKLLMVLPEIGMLDRPSNDIIPMNEMAVGKLLQFSVNQCPSLAKSWNSFGTWCYRWGRKIVDHNSENKNNLSQDDCLSIQQMFPNSGDLSDIFTILSRSHIDDEIDDQVSTADMISVQLKQILTNATDHQLQVLLQIWKNTQKRIYTYYALSADAYFRYLQLSDNSANNVITVTLRLLRLIVKYALQLQNILEEGLQSTPTQPWKVIIPQLFSRLNHPESYVRQRVSDLLCRIAEDAPHLITFPAVVGALEGGLKFDFSEISLPKDCLSQSNDCQQDDDINDDDYDSDHEDYTTNALQSCFKTMVDTLSKQDPETISQVQLLVKELRRITLLWDELWLGTLAQHQNEITKRQQQLEYEIEKVNDNPSLSSEAKISLIAEKNRIIIKPIIFILEQLEQVTGVEAETPHEQQFQQKYADEIRQVIRKLKNPDNPDKPLETLQPLKQLQKQFQQKFHMRRTSYSLKMQSISPVLASIKNTVIAMPGLRTKATVTISHVSNTVSILPTKTKPKKLIFYGSDGQTYTYLFKGLEDLHLDERIMQFLTIANTMMATNADFVGSSDLYRARHYSVIPLGPRSGLISWVDGTTPVFALYKRWQQRELAKPTAANKSSASSSILRPSELFYNKLNPLLKEHGIKNIDNRKEWPLSILKQVLTELMAETPSDLLAKELWCNSVNAASWFQVVKRYSYSVAVMSIIGYIIGLGDRHLDNMLVDLTSGEVVHIDYNVCFEKGKTLRVPEKVPFRLTPNIRRALGVTQVEGIFRMACENVLKTMRKGRETLLTLLEAFVYDPLIDWTIGGEVLAGTTFGGVAASANGKQSKKNLEKEITVSMFNVRCTEIKFHWTENKQEILQRIPPLVENFNLWLEVHQKIDDVEDNLQDLHQQMALVKEAEAYGLNKHHSLYDLPSRYENYCKSQETMNAAKRDLDKIMADSENHITMYGESLKLLDDPKLQQWISESKNPAAADLNVFDLVKEFLHNAGKDDVITQCQQSESDVEQLFQCQNLTIKRCLQLLQDYNAILMQCPKSYIENHRMYHFLKWTKYMVDCKTVDSCDKVYEKFRSFLEIKDAKNTLQFSYSLETMYKETMTQVNKLYDELTAIETQETNTGLEKLYAGTRMSVSTFLNCEKGATSAYAFVIANELLVLNKNFLTLETTASRSGDLLIKLTSKDGDWFLDDLVLNSTRAVEMINNLPLSQNGEDEKFLKLLNGIRIANNVYKGLHELHFNFHTIILPESMRKIQNEDGSVIKMIADLNSLIGGLGSTIPEMIVQLEKILPCLYMQMDISPSLEAALEQVATLRKKFHSITEASSDHLSDGKMLLMGFNGLFEKLHQEMDYLVGVLTGTDIPPSWKRLDQVKDSKSISAHIFHPKVRAVLQDIFLLKRLQTMSEFFRLSTDMCQSFKNTGKFVVYSDEQLLKPIRQFIADFISKQLLGITTEAIAYTICFLLQHLKLSVSHEIEQKDIGAESKVPLDELVQKAWNYLLKQGVFTQNVLSQASGFSTSLKRTWEKIQEPKKIELKLALMQSSAFRIQNQLTVYNFMYEEILAHLQVYNTVRTKFISDLKHEVSTLKTVHLKLSEAREKQQNLIKNAYQRLNWAKGANPNVVEISSAFEAAVAARDTKLNLDDSVGKDVLAACTTILQHETLRTHSNESKTQDKLFLGGFEKWRLACQYASSKLEVLTPPEEGILNLLTPELLKNPKWLHEVSEIISNLIKTTQSTLEKQKTKLFCLFDTLTTALDKLKDAYDAHCKLMSDVKMLIKTMTKIDDYSIQALEFINDYRQYIDYFTIIFGKFKKETTPDDIYACLDALGSIRESTETIYDGLLALETKKSKPQLVRQDATNLVKEQAHRQQSLTKGQQRNAYAVGVWRRVKMKLEGRDPDPGRKYTPQDQVDYVIQEATNLDNLALLYEGWTPWV